jgi:transcriptional regulator with XRE-family HTH domain
MGKESFGPNLRRRRELRGISLDAVAARTNVSVAMLGAMEENDFSNWPGGVYARSFVRAYAEAVGVDADETVEDFCRWFPIADRRAERVIRAHAEIVGVDLQWRDDQVQSLPQGDRRAKTATGAVAVWNAWLKNPVRRRAIAAALDAAVVLVLATLATVLLRTGMLWPLTLTGFLYHTAGVIALGGSPAVVALDRYLIRQSSGFAVHDRAALRESSAS